MLKVGAVGEATRYLTYIWHFVCYQ